MIELKNAIKVFGGRLTAINNTSITFDKGLTTLLGRSGSGKTTLLNAVGGLEKLTSGQLYVDGELYNSSINSRQYRNLRRDKIGFIFQHYYLFNSKTVFENLKESLNIIGIFDEEEIENRIKDALEAVELYRYRNRHVSALSGGQQQRIAIARAIIKNPDIILADEPTGNLDSVNTFEIMSILKNLSKTKTVILVTHEHDIAKFFSDRIVEIADGRVVKDYINDNSEATFDINNNNKLYLKDYECENISTNDSDINFYTDGSVDLEQLKMKFIAHQDGIITDIEGEYSYELANNGSDIELIQDNYKPLTIKDVGDNEFNFSFRDELKKNSYYPFNIKDVRTSAVKPKKFLTRTRVAILGIYSLFSCLLFLYITMATLSISGLALVPDTEDNYIMSVSDVKDLIQNDAAATSIDHLADFYDETMLMASPYVVLPATEISQSDLLFGTMPTKNNEYVLTTGMLSYFDLYKEDFFNAIGTSLSSDNVLFLLGTQFYLPSGEDHIIVGVVQDNYSRIYGDFNTFLEMPFNSYISNYSSDSDYYHGNVINYESASTNTNFTKFDITNLGDKEVLLNRSLSGLYKLDDEIILDGTNYTVAGYYDHAEDYNYVIMSKATMIRAYVECFYPSSDSDQDDYYFAISTDNTFSLDKYLDDNDISNTKVLDIFGEIDLLLETGLTTAFYIFTIFISVVLAIIVGYRLGNINYDLAVYKSLGVKKLHLIIKYSIKTMFLPLLCLLFFSTIILYSSIYINNLSFVVNDIFDLSASNVFQFLFTQVVVILAVSTIPVLIKTNISINKLYQKKN